MRKPSAKNLLFLLSTFFVAASLTAGEIWTETKYFAPSYQLNEKVPVVGADWKVYSKSRILLGQDVECIEYLEGIQKGTTAWLVGNTIVTLLKSGDTVIGAKAQGDAINWISPVEGASWTKGQKPFAVNHEKGEKILVFDSGGEPGKPTRRAWISAESLKSLAEFEGKFITIFEKQESNAPVNPPSQVQTAIKRQRDETRKLSRVGAMPQ